MCSVVQWHVGDHCQAVFTDDGDLYHAVIKSIDAAAGTCVVRYIGYGNEEEHKLDDVLVASSAPNGYDQAESDLASQVREGSSASS